MINKIDHSFRPEAENKKPKLKRSKPDLNNSVMVTDCEKLNAVITNLMKNTFKYTTNGSFTFWS